MEFKDKHYDGTYEVSKIEFYNPINKITEFVLNPLKNADHVIISKMAHDPY